MFLRRMMLLLIFNGGFNELTGEDDVLDIELRREESHISMASCDDDESECSSVFTTLEQILYHIGVLGNLPDSISYRHRETSIIDGQDPIEIDIHWDIPFDAIKDEIVKAAKQNTFSSGEIRNSEKWKQVLLSLVEE